MVTDTFTCEELNSSQPRYQFWPAKAAENKTALQLSMQQMGLLSPIIVHRHQGKYCILDGFKRLQIAETLQIKELPCHVLPPNTPLLQLAVFLFQKNQPILIDSAAQRSKFFTHFQQLGLTKDDTGALFTLMGIENHPRLLRQYLSVGELPDDVLIFCHEKRFSLKQCTHLSKHPRALLIQLFAWRDKLHLTAGIIEEILGNFKDILRAEQLEFNTLANEPAFIELMEKNCTVQQRTLALRTWLRLRRFPRLSKIQNKMNGIAQSLSLPPQIKLQWDSTLENRALSFTVHFTEPEQWPGLLNTLQQDSIHQAITLLLDEI